MASDWKTHQDIITNIGAIILPKLQEERDKIERLTKSGENELNVAERKLQESQNRVTQLKNVSDTILSAVSIIAANLPKDEGDCPVCNTSYEPAELQSRMANAVGAVDPLLLEALEKNKQDAGNVDLKKNNLNKHKQDFEKIDNELKGQQDLVRESTSLINETIIPKFPSFKTFSEAFDWIKTKRAEIDAELISVTKERETLEKEPTLEQVDQLSLQKGQIEKDIEETQRQIQHVQQKIVQGKETLAGLNQKIGTATFDQLVIDITEQEKSIKELTDQLESTKQKLTDQNSILEENDKTIMTIKGAIAQLTGQQNEIKTRWSQAKLEGLPNLEGFNKRKKLAETEESTLKSNKETLDKINDELARWKTAEQFDLYTQEIKKLSGSLDETQYLSHLQSNSKKFEQDVVAIEEKKKTLTTLYSKISGGIDMAHEYIKSINPLWSALLKRVVVNPRFFDITLDSYSYHNRPHANVKVDLHNNKVNVMEVASEAQITDLQLTFMLSMAKTYSWTPWKALLLDDPTQHHDLVHAAGVFDLLRDNIIDGGFQVLLGTHDSMQARFFQRKLQNDGVPVHLWNLLADETGVKAERME